MRLAHTPFTPAHWARALQLTLLGLVGLLSACGSSTPDTTPPSVTLTASPGTLTAAGPVSLMATATDNVGVSKVEFYEGSTLLATDDSAPYTTSVNLSTASNGTHQYSAAAYDAAGNKATAQAPQVQVSIPVPVLSLTASQRTLSATSGTATITASISHASSSAVTWTIASGGGTLSQVTATSVVYTAPSVTQDTIVAIKATSQAEAQLSEQLSLIVIAPTVVNSVSVTANPATIGNNATSTLTATIAGTGNPNPNAKWEIVSGGGALSASSGARVTYAPPTVTADATVTIKASSVDDPSKSATTTITVKPSATITGVTATAAQTTLVSGTTAQLSANVTGYGGANLGVKWSIPSGQGTLSSTSGATTTYTAPSVSTSTKIQVKAESVQDASKSTLIDLTVNPKPAVTVSVTPSPATVKSAQKVMLTGAVANASNQNLTWTIVSGGGTITPTDASGKQADYTAPAVTSNTTVTIKATSVEDPTKSATSTITVQAPVLSLRIHWLDSRYFDADGYSISGPNVTVPLGGLFHVWTLKDGVEVNTPVNFTLADPTVAMIHHTNGGGLALIGGIKPNSNTTLTASVDGLSASISINVTTVQKQKPATMFPFWQGMMFIRPDGTYGVGETEWMGKGVVGYVGQPIILPVPALGVGGSGGYQYNLVLGNNGRVYGAGAPQNGTGAFQGSWVDLGITGMAFTASHYQTNYFVSNDSERRVYSYGANFQGQACQNTGLTQGLTPFGFTGGTGAYRLSAGTLHVVLIGSTGQVWACGSNKYGELGRGGTGDSISGWASSLRVPSVIDCASGDGFSVCITPSRHLVAWGRQAHGQFGLGNDTTLDTPMELPGISGVLDVKCNIDKCIVRTWDGTLYGSGLMSGYGFPNDNTWYFTKLPNTPNNVIQIAVSEYNQFYYRTADDAYFRMGNPPQQLDFSPPNISVSLNVIGITIKQGENPEVFGTAQGTSFSKVNFASENTSIVDVEPIYVPEHNDSAIRLHWKSPGSTFITAQSALGGAITRIPVTAQGNDPPQIKRFYEQNGNYNPAPWDTLILKWEVWDPNGDSMTCRLDLDNDGYWDHQQPNCTDGNQYTHVWNNLQTGARTIKMQLEDSRGAKTTQFLGFDVRANNNPPVIASFTANPSSGTAPLTTTFNWSVSDSDNDALTCQLDLNGDGTFDPAFACASRSSQTYTYTTNGSYNAKLKVTDGRGGETSRTQTVTLIVSVTPPPSNYVSIYIDYFMALPPAALYQSATPNALINFFGVITTSDGSPGQCELKLYKLNPFDGTKTLRYQTSPSCNNSDHGLDVSYFLNEYGQFEIELVAKTPTSTDTRSLKLLYQLDRQSPLLSNPSSQYYKAVEACHIEYMTSYIPFGDSMKVFYNNFWFIATARLDNQANWDKLASIILEAIISARYDALEIIIGDPNLKATYQNYIASKNGIGLLDCMKKASVYIGM